ncbi:MAG: hypothetical protein BWY86_00681 [Candidatus Aminicenantes bacterium ADurb.Bin508]|nr:MAG: hypothetical protein BWY86_00681 [Candidatus Aminicenantes bacterium ADurb.Bin508]
MPHPLSPTSRRAYFPLERPVFFRSWGPSVLAVSVTVMVGTSEEEHSRASRALMMRLRKICISWLLSPSTSSPSLTAFSRRMRLGTECLAISTVSSRILERFSLLFSIPCSREKERI